MKKKERAKGKSKDPETPQDGPATFASGAVGEGPIKKRRRVNGSEVVFRLPGDESDEEEREGDAEEVRVAESAEEVSQPQETAAPVVHPNIKIYDLDS